MKPRKQGGVVHSRLSLYGVRGLKFANLSIGSDNNVSANPYSTALVVWAKATVIIAEEGIKGAVCEGV